MNTPSTIIAATVVGMLAQADMASISPWAQYGLPGLVIGYFVWRDYRQQLTAERRQSIDDGKFDKLVQSVNSLVRVTSIEVLSRPHVADRIKAETEEIVSNLRNRES